MKRLIFVVGPTASGKSKLAIELAKRFGGEIISCDSIQVYKGLDIGSAKPTAEEMEKVPHHLISHVQKGEEYTAGDFRRDVLEIIETSSAKIFWVVGGTGFYFKALEKGMVPAPPINEDVKITLHKDLEQLGISRLYKELEEADPERAKQISKNDSYRILRALEILRSGVLPSELAKSFSEDSLPYPVLKVGIQIDRELLRERLLSRTKAMLEAGFEAEVDALRKQGLKHWQPMQSVGYKEMQALLDGDLKREDLLQTIVNKSMQLAKRQMTWFRADKEIQWFSSEQILDLDKIVKEFLDGEQDAN